MERFTISFSNSFATDRNNAFAAKLIKNYVVSAPTLYRVIADHLGVDVSGIPVGTDDKSKKLEVAALRDRIREDGANLACVGVAESTMAAIVVQRPVFVKPVRRCDRKPVAKPVKRPAIKVVGCLSVAVARPVKFVRPVKNGIMV